MELNDRIKEVDLPCLCVYCSSCIATSLAHNENKIRKCNETKNNWYFIKLELFLVLGFDNT